MSNRNVSVLYIGSDKTDQMALESLVRADDLPYHLTAVDSLPAAKKILNSDSFDIAIFYHQAGDGTALDIHAEIKNIPYIIITSSGNEEIAAKAIRHGACDYVIKDPAGNYLNVLPLTIESVLSRKHAQTKLEKQENYIEILKAERTILQENKELLDNILTASGVGIAHIKDRKIIWANEAMASILGFTNEDDYLGKDTRIIYASDEEYLRIGKLIYETPVGRVVETEAKLKRYDDNREIYGQIKVNIMDPSDPKKGVIINIIDITERIQAEKALKESEYNLKEAQEIAHIGHWRLNAKTNEVIGSDELFHIFGISSDEATLEKFVEAVHPDDREYDLDHIKRGLTEGIPWDIEHRLLSKDGTQKTVHAKGEALRDKKRNIVELIGIVQDITERKRAEKALQESEKKYRTLVESSLQGILIIQDLKVIFANQTMSKISGYSIDEFLSFTPEDINNLVHPEDQELVFQRLIDRLEGKPVPDHYEFRAVRKDGSVRWCETYAGIIDFKGAPATLGTYYDITERKLTEAKTAEWKTRYETTILMSGHILYEWDTVTNEVKYGGNVEKILGYSKDELEGRDKIWSELIHPGDRKDYLKSMDHIIQLVETVHLEYRVKKKNGEYIIVEDEGNFIKDAEGRATKMLGFIKDISKRKRAEEEKEKFRAQLIQTQKMEAIGTLAGGIAHDFNNILFSIIGFTEMCLGQVLKGSPLEENLKAVFDAGIRASDLVKQILTFSRQSDQELQPVMVKIIAKEALKLLRASIPTTIEIRQSIQSDSMVMGNPTHIHQILMNLCTNAAYAMGGGIGVLEVSLRNVEVKEENTEKNLELPPGEYLNIVVRDTGKGIDSQFIDRIFEPYFTTKEIGKGTGMGLAVVHGIIKSYEGTINVESEPGKGSTFSIYLPIIEEVSEEESITENELPTGTERILFVDDEVTLCRIVRQILGGLGYHVEAFSNPLEAIKTFEIDPGKYDLVLTDMAMPKLSGDKLAEKVLKLRKDIPVIVCTGYSAHISEENVKEIGIKALLMKPLRRRDLSFIIRDVLDNG